MTARPLPEDGPSNVVPRDTSALRGALLRFPGGPVDATPFVESHNGPTPSSRLSSADLLEMALEAVTRAQRTDELKQRRAILVAIDHLQAALDRLAEEA